MKNVKTIEVVNVYNILNSSKYRNLNDSDKIKVWKICRELKSISDKYNEDKEDLINRLKPENFDIKFQRGREYEELLKRKANGEEVQLNMSVEEYNDIVKEYQSYDELIKKGIDEISNKEIELNIEPLTKESFGIYMSSNDWTMEQVIKLGDVIVDN